MTAAPIVHQRFALTDAVGDVWVFYARNFGQALELVESARNVTPIDPRLVRWTLRGEALFTEVDKAEWAEVDARLG